MWLAGAGVKPGLIYGATDEYGYYAVENRVHVHDLHATLLHLLRVRSHAIDISVQRQARCASPMCMVRSCNRF